MKAKMPTGSSSAPSLGLRRIARDFHRDRTEVVAINLEDLAVGVQLHGRSVAAEQRGSESVARHLKDVGMAEHFVENPGVRRIDRILAVTRIGPFVHID